MGCCCVMVIRRLLCIATTEMIHYYIRKDEIWRFFLLFNQEIKQVSWPDMAMTLELAPIPDSQAKVVSTTSGNDIVSSPQIFPAKENGIISLPC